MSSENDYRDDPLLGDEELNRDEFDPDTGADFNSPAYDFREFEDLYIDEKGDSDSDYEDAIENYPDE